MERESDGYASAIRLSEYQSKFIMTGEPCALKGACTVRRGVYATPKVKSNVWSITEATAFQR
jgi:hypothetical protein